MQATLKEFKAQDGTLPAYAWPGGYPIVYIFGDGEVCCPKCANTEKQIKLDPAEDDMPDKSWTLVDWEIHWEGPAEYCAHCGALIESAYGDPDAETEGQEA